MRRLFKNIPCIIQPLLQVLIFFIPVVIIYYLFRYVPLEGHDFSILYGRNFIHPEHGRYIATWFGNLLMERLPVFVNIHVFDLNLSLFIWVKIFICLIIFSIISYGFLLFFDKKSKKDVWIWLLGYIASFFILFTSCFYHFSISQLTVFFEYTTALIPFLIFLIGIIYFYTKEKLPTKPIYILLLISAFFSGITVEVLNVPSLMIITFVTLFVYIDFLRSDKTNVIKLQRHNFFLTLFCIHLFSVILYYINPTDHEFGTEYILSVYWKSHMLECFSILVSKLLPFHILNLITIGLILILRKNQQSQNIRFVSCIILSNLCCIFFYTVAMCLIVCVIHLNTSLYFGDYKNFIPYIVVLLLNNFLLLGYLISSYTSLNEKKLYILKILAIVIVILTNFKFIDKKFSIYQEIHANGVERRQQIYQIEKSIVKQRGQDTIIIPIKNYEEFFSPFGSYCNTIFILYYPDFQNVKTIVTDKNLAPEELTEEEKKNLKFSNLLPHKINKYEGYYNIEFEKYKTENSKIYYKKKLPNKNLANIL